MAITCEYRYEKPKTLQQALELLAQYKAKAKILAGGTDLVVHLKEDMVAPDLVLDLKGIEQLQKLEIKQDNIFIGAGVTFTELIESSEIKTKLPILWNSSETVASVGVRNRATLTGNICSAVPSLDAGPALLVYDAHVLVQNQQGKRTISIHDWFTGPKRTSLQADELVLGVKVPLTKHLGTYEKLGRYRGEDLAQAGIALYITDDWQYRFAHCAVGPVAARMPQLENFMRGKKLQPQLWEAAAELIPSEISPISDIRSSAEYRVHMMKIMFQRGLEKMYLTLQGGE
ncbi:MAG: xanthine dehydrogenase family protein subunit M [Candidatus Cloacimonadales bacterium]